MLADYWASRAVDPDAVLLSSEMIAAHNTRLAATRDAGWPVVRQALDEPIDRDLVKARLAETAGWLRKEIVEKHRVAADGHVPAELPDTFEHLLSNLEETNEFRIARRSTPLRCYPFRDGLYEATDQLAFDLMQCAQLSFGEVVRIVAKSKKYWYAWTSYASGWISPTDIGPKLTRTQVTMSIRPKNFVVAVRDRVPVWSSDRKPATIIGVLRLGVRLPRLVDHPNTGSTQGSIKVYVPTETGLGTGHIRRTQGVRDQYEPFTQRALFGRAFELLDSPYGWGGTGSKRDCSRLLMDVFASFGIRLPRNSSRQATAGMNQIDVSQLSETQKRNVIVEAAQTAVVLLYFPGHIMLYVGNEDRQLYAFHQFSAYREACAGGGETAYRVNRATVTTLDLGRSSKRRSFIERITTLVVFGMQK